MKEHIWNSLVVLVAATLVGFSHCTRRNLNLASSPNRREESLDLDSEESESFSPEIIPAASYNEEEISEIGNIEDAINNETSCGRNGFTPDFDSVQVFPTLGFHDSWISGKWFWNAKDFNFEQRFVERFKTKTPPPQVRAFVVPHSHSDPGWLKTFEGYFNSNTKHTLDLAVEKLDQFPNMTFVWNEISFLSKWWEYATLEQRLGFRRLVEEGRLEVLTGGWVMQDEATVNLYSMIDQLIEGRQWVKSRLGIVPNISWSIDPFGHGSVFPYVLKQAGIDNMVIQRLHYAWKKYLGQHEYGNFEWVQRWDTKKKHSITCHNAPYDLYTTKHTCGPDPYVCLKFDFRNIYGEYSEYMRHSRPVTKSNVKYLAEQLVEQLQKTASLQPHNIVMFPLGDDFRFDKDQEWDQQYDNYVPLMNYINSHWSTFKLHISFGTVSDYFRAVNQLNHELPTFTGDYFPYSDVYVSGRPAYWTGFYGTRPFWKKLYRETEANLRGAEIAFTYTFNLCRQTKYRACLTILTREYDNLIVARRNLALFAHHDGSTGTSRRLTMDDYGRKLLDASKTAMHIQKTSVMMTMQQSLNLTVPSLSLDYQVQNFGDIPTKIARIIYESTNIVKKIVLYNSLSWKRVHLAKILVTDPNVAVYGGESKIRIESQLNPVVSFDEKGMKFRDRVFELCFLADLDPLSITIFEVRKLQGDTSARVAEVSCTNCAGSDRVFQVDRIDPQGPMINIGNGEVEILLSPENGMLRRITKVREDLGMNVLQSFGGYKSLFRDSGAYLLKPDVESDIPIPFEEASRHMLLVEGPITSYLTMFAAPMKFTVRIVNSPGNEIAGAVLLENVVDLGSFPTEIYMRFDTEVNSTFTLTSTGQKTNAFYTDQSGYTFEKRIKVESINYEGNNYPVNTMAYVQDTSARFSVLVDRSHGFSSMESGRLETLIERRTQFDDGRGMSEGVTDNKKTISKYILLLERISRRSDDQENEDYVETLPTLQSLHLSYNLNYPVSHFLFDDIPNSFTGTFGLTNGSAFPPDSHLVSLRTLSKMEYPLELEKPQEEALMIVQKLGYFDKSPTCPGRNESKWNEQKNVFNPDWTFNKVTVSEISHTDLAAVSGLQSPGHSRNFTDFVRNLTRTPFEIIPLLIRF